MAEIYKITNKINRKTYVGHIIRELKEKLHEHLKNIKDDFKLLIYCTIKKYK